MRTGSKREARNKALLNPIYAKITPTLSLNTYVELDFITGKNT